MSDGFEVTIAEVYFKSNCPLSLQLKRATLTEAMDDAVKDSFMFTDGLPQCGYVELTRTEIIRIPNDQFTPEQIREYTHAERVRAQNAKGNALKYLAMMQGEDEEQEVIGVDQSPFANNIDDTQPTTGVTP